MADKIQIDEPIKMVFDFPTRGNSAQPQKGVGKPGAIIWKSIKMFPADQRQHSSQIQLVEGVIDEHTALKHFAKITSIELDKIKVKSSKGKPAVSSQSFPLGQVIEIDLSAAGWSPGSTTVYIISPTREKAIQIDSTFHLNFNWKNAKIHW